MNFHLYFEFDDLVDAKNYIPDLFDKFLFNSDNKTYEVDIEVAFIVSDKVKEIIKKDPTVTEYALKKDCYKEEFLEHFFTSITHKKITIDNEYLQDFINITKELKINRMRKSIKSTVFSYLCKSISENKKFNSDDEMIDFLHSNISQLNIELLKGKPYDIIWEIITNSKSKFANENDYALFILNFFDKFEFDNSNIKDKMMIDYIDTIQLKNLSYNVYEKVLSTIKDNDEKSYLFNNILERELNEISKNKIEINLLNITLKNCIDFNFLTKLNLQNDKYKINVTIIFFEQFESMSNNYLDQFDILILGGHDFMASYNGFSKLSYQKVESFRKRKGTLILLHDISAWQIISPFYNLLGGKYNVNDSYDGFNKIKFDINSSKTDIISSPFLVGTDIDIASTHQTIKLNPCFSVLNAVSTNAHYYAERLKESIAEFTMGHTHILGDQEQKLFYNIICHLYTSRLTLIKLKLL